MNYDEIAIGMIQDWGQKTGALKVGTDLSELRIAIASALQEAYDQGRRSEMDEDTVCQPLTEADLRAVEMAAGQESEN